MLPQERELDTHEENCLASMPPSEKDMEILNRDLDVLEEEFKVAKAEADSLRTQLAVEAQNRQAAESLCSALEAEKARLIKFQEEFLTQTVQELDYRSKYDGLWQEINLKNEQENAKEKEHKKAVSALKEKLQILEQELNKRISYLERQLHLKDSCVVQLEQEIAQLHENMDIMTQSHEQSRKKDHLEFQREVARLRKELQDAQEANGSLNIELQRQEQSAILERSKLEAQIQDLSSNWHVGALKQKLMKLRKENDDLKRRFIPMH